MTFGRYILANIAAMLMAASLSAHAQPNSTAFRSEYAPVSGLRMYYEIHGTGQPLILVHGGLGSSDMFAMIVPELSKGRQVIAVDLQAHGRTVDIDRPLSFETMADDIAALIHYLGFEKADVMGYSVGSEVALRAAIQHPGVVRKLLLSPPHFGTTDGIRRSLQEWSIWMKSVAEQMKQTPMYQGYQTHRSSPPRLAGSAQKTGCHVQEQL